jgi:hypothetical protein
MSLTDRSLIDQTLSGVWSITLIRFILSISDRFMISSELSILKWLGYGGNEYQ